MQAQNKGFNYFVDGKLMATSTSSVFGDRLTTGTVSVPVPGLPGVFALLRPGEHAQLLAQPDRMDKIVEAAHKVFGQPTTTSKSTK